MKSRAPRGKQSLSNNQCQQIVSSILQNIRNIDLYISNGQLRSLLTSKYINNDNTIYDILKSFNQYLKHEDTETRNVNKFLSDIFESNFLNCSLRPLMEKFILYKPEPNNFCIFIEFFTYSLEYNNVAVIAENFIIMSSSLLLVGAEFAEDKSVCQLMSDFKGILVKAKEIALQKQKKTIVNATKNIDSNQSLHIFRTISVTPTPDDIFCAPEDVKIRKNKFDTEDKSYESVDDYLDLQFRLLREDFMRPLRNSISEIANEGLSRLNRKKINVRIYEDVSIEELYPSRNNLFYRVKFNLTKLPRNLDWNKARRFIFGSLLCFTNDSFDSIYIGTVVDSNPKSLSKGYVMVQFNDRDPIKEILNNNNFLMLETKNLFEAYKHVLLKLQDFQEDTFPFKENIVYTQTSVKSPKYLKMSDLRKIEALSNESSQFGFDESQFDAFKTALLSNVSLIQGPPGTGKTYVGLKLMSYLSKNFQQNIGNNNIGPILIVCYTNHALDQFLSEIIDELGSDGILRIGGQSRNEKIINCNLQKVKQSWISRRAFPKFISKEYVCLKNSMGNLEQQLVQMYSYISECDCDKMKIDNLSLVMKPQHCQYFKRINIKDWLSGSDECDNTPFSQINNLAANRFLKRIIEDTIIEDLFNIVTNEVNLLNEANKELNNEDTESFINKERKLDEDEDFENLAKKFERFYFKNDDFDDDDENDLENLPFVKIEDDKNTEKFKTVANKKWLKRRIRQAIPIDEIEYNTQINDLSRLTMEDRVKVYKYWLTKNREVVIEEFHRLKLEYEELLKQQKKLMGRQDALIMLKMKVIGMTTTGAARYGDVLEQIACRIVIVEEAAEVLESHTVAALSENCEQVILIGDHLQLRPKVDEYDLEQNYNLGISLFERLVFNGCTYRTLKYQHRMRPEIAKCVKCIYPSLENNSNVYEYNNVAGMGSDMYWFSHKEKESGDKDTDTSFRNDYEALFISNLCQYLIKLGNSPSQITVITFYSGQLYALQNLIRGQQYRGMRICVLDNYQGEENDIIILSFVRSERVGFLKSPNRLCVALSRAKRGFYLFGNFKFLRQNIPLLSDIMTNHIPEIFIGNQLPLKCPQHSTNENTDFVYYASKPNDLLLYSCGKICGMKLKCSHVCVNRCHWSNPGHTHYKCKEIVNKECKRKLHIGAIICSQTFICRDIINVVLPKCNHQADILCYVNEKAHNCQILCDKALECGHNCLKKCFEKCVCTHRITKVMNCGHPIEVECGININLFKCTKKVEKLFETCGHVNSYECWRNLNECNKKNKIDLQCGHILMVNCKDGPRKEVTEYHCDYKCQCTLHCTHTCNSDCGECLTIWKLHKPCKRLCPRILPCGHICNKKCHTGLACPPCNAKCTKHCQHTNQNCTKMCSDIDCLAPNQCDECYPNIIKLEPCSCEIDVRITDPIITIHESNVVILKCPQCKLSLKYPLKSKIYEKYLLCIARFYTKPDELQMTKCLEILDEFNKLKQFHKIDWDNLKDNWRSTRIFHLRKDNFNQMVTYVTKLEKMLPVLKEKNYSQNIQKVISKIEWIIELLLKICLPNNKLSLNETKFCHSAIDQILFVGDIINCLNDADNTEYGLVVGDCLRLFDEVLQTNPVGRFDLWNAWNKWNNIRDEIRIKLKIKTESTDTENDKLIERIINAKRISTEFQWTDLSVEEKLKELIKLIRLCHPDKNKSPKAKEASQKLLNEKAKYEKLL